ncbi:hypothetical protein FHS59_002416 [Algoriphagus iocasae]|uniref:Uncharacterized protein n=1 Tax=Algoriphagus iocasae TaxID=1836499 RepID=A0A841MW05_9BACT|nr:hypothetical protein [Algoriphagus iocasae]
MATFFYLLVVALIFLFLVFLFVIVFKKGADVLKGIFSRDKKIEN